MSSISRERLFNVSGLVLAGGLALAGVGHCLLGTCRTSSAEAAVVTAKTAAGSHGAEIATAKAAKAVTLKTDHFAIRGMFCANCARLVTEQVRKVAGVKAVDVDYETGKGTITYEAGKVDPARLIQAIKKAGYKARKT
ncbi:MAG: heavy-metal-associated domain-containing protein [Cyanobacteria bacterium REEB65]|nr:heavy-metal-associated domain-containing protein [Cyanobacteria bacterium REEB65]